MRRDERLRKEAQAAEAAKLLQRQRAAAHARTALAGQRAAAVLRGDKPDRRDRKPVDPHLKSLPGRIDWMLAKMGKRRRDLAVAVGLTTHSIAVVARGEGQSYRPTNLAKIAEFLNVTPEWLLHGDDSPPAQANGANGAPLLLPQAATVFKANGAHHHRSREGRIEIAMQTNIDAAMVAMWSLLPLDLKAFLVARTAELLAKGSRAVG